jgi:hypothetical protein
MTAHIKNRPSILRLTLLFLRDKLAPDWFFQTADPVAAPRERGGRSCLENPLYPLANPLLYVYNHF